MESWHSLAIRKANWQEIEHVALLTWACRSTLSPAANTSGCDEGEEQHRRYTSGFAWCRTGRNPRERSGTSHQFGVGLEIGKTIFNCQSPLGNKSKEFQLNIEASFFKALDFASTFFSKEHLNLKTEVLSSGWYSY